MRILWAGCLLAGIAACGPAESPPPRLAANLRIGFGLTNGITPSSGVEAVTGIMTRDGLVSFGRDARPRPWLSDRWSTSTDGRTIGIHLRSARFQDGRPATASVVAASLSRSLPARLGRLFENVGGIAAVSDDEIEIRLKERSNLAFEALDGFVETTDVPPVGTGPFIVAKRLEDGSVRLRSNDDYFAGKPSLESIEIRPYDSIRAAWADMLRGNLDMLYEVGNDAMSSLGSSADARVYTYARNYVLSAILNVSRPGLRDPAVRRMLNEAIDRQALIGSVFSGHGVPASGPVRETHWAHDDTWPAFSYAPKPLGQRLVLTCLLGEASHERMALALKQSLEAIGVELRLELPGIDVWMQRAGTGDFDILLADVQSGPTLLLPWMLWSSRGPRNWGRYASPAVDAAFDAIDRAPDEAAYRTGVAALQRAIVEDPPAIFIAWGERARAVSSRFEVYQEPGRDIIGTFRLWKPSPLAPMTGPD